MSDNDEKPFDTSITIEEIKQYLHLDDDSEDEYIHILIILAAEICENYTRETLPEELPKSYKQAMLMIIGYFFENREGSKMDCLRRYFIFLLHIERLCFR